ncbi:glutamate-gated chloride channel-like [Sitophilus oryzae]|uniref:pH-sensitive chloride channel 2 n=1 Tax=Sitophilus oryzae TaxID=7048 RepID=A0A6J2XXG8_SITOR|nr:glutamate-gated chloride channel-like [Sitophilus oryzae]
MWTSNYTVWCVVFFGSVFRDIFCQTRIAENCPPLQPPMDNLTQEEFLAALTSSCRYDRLIRPPSENRLDVDFQIDVKHIENAGNTQFKSHLLVQVSFQDDRLKFADLSPNRGNILGQETLRSKVWVPHIVVKNERNSGLMGLDQKDVFVKINPSGRVLYSFRMTTTFYCAMNLRKFPFDNQLCEIIWTSWAYNDTNLHLQWVKYEPFTIAKNLHLTEFSLDDMWVEDATTQDTGTDKWDDGYSSLVFKFKLKREVGYYILDYFLPSILLVMISWFSFWIQTDSSPARTTLGTTTMLSFITLNGNVMKNLPKVNYVTASEVWFFGGATFIFLSLAEFAFVNIIWRRKKKVEIAKQSSKYILKGAVSPRLARKEVRKLDSFSSADNRFSGNFSNAHGSSNSLNVPTINAPTTCGGSDQNVEAGSPPTPTPSQQWAEMNPRDVAIWIDRKARIVFPATFLVFNILYWNFVYAL